MNVPPHDHTLSRHTHTQTETGTQPMAPTAVSFTGASSAAPAAETSITEAVKDAWEELYQALDQYVLLPSSSSPQRHQYEQACPLQKAWLQSVLPAQALRVVLDSGLGSLVLEYVAEGLDQELVKVVRPAFWRHFQQEKPQHAKNVDDEEHDEQRQCQTGFPEWVYTRMRAALTCASQALQERDRKLALLGEFLRLPHQTRQECAMLHTRFAAIVFNTAPKKEGVVFWERWWVIFFRTSLRAWHKAWRERRQGRERGERRGRKEGDMMSVEDVEEEEEEEEEVVEEEEGACVVRQEEVEVAWRALRRLGWLPLVQSAVTQVMKGETERYIERTCKGVYDVPRLGQVGAWKDAVLMPWLERLMEGGEEGGEEGSNMVVTPSFNSKSKTASSSSFQEWRLRHAFSVYESFAGVRMLEMFDIIRDFPDSLPAVLELREALEVTQQHGQLAGLLRESMRSRLLHNGANTMQIIDVYIATIKALRELDPSDSILEAVAHPIRAYLQGRKDTVRCIVSSLTDEEGGGDLYEELRRQDGRLLEEEGEESGGEDGGGREEEKVWMPARREAGTMMSERRKGEGRDAGGGGGRDILWMLISIYGSKDLFVSEYRLMLAEKLLNLNLNAKSWSDYDTDKEVIKLELLKKRFGEGGALQPCEIMIRDVEDSKRVNALVAARLREKARGRGRGRRGWGWFGKGGVGGGDWKLKVEEGLKMDKAQSAAAAVAVDRRPLGGGGVSGGEGSGGREGEREGEGPSDIEVAMAAAKAEEQRAATCVDATIVSHHFWPPLQEEELVLHPTMAGRMTDFASAYSVLKNPRKLEWKPQLGLVTLDLEFDCLEVEREEEGGREGGIQEWDEEAEKVVKAWRKEERRKKRVVARSFTVSPVHATLIMHFGKEEDDTGSGLEEERSQTELGQLTSLPLEVVARKMTFWVNQGIVSLSSTPSPIPSFASPSAAAAVEMAGGGLTSPPNFYLQQQQTQLQHQPHRPGEVYYKLITKQDPDGPDGQGHGGGRGGSFEDDDLEAAVSSDAQEAKETDVYISYVLGMLGTYGGRSARAIHDTLKIWAGGDQQTYSLHLGEVERILQRLVGEEKLEMVDGVYQLANRPAHHR